MHPVNAIKIPEIFFADTLRPKIKMPAIIANMGVSALSVPARALSIFVSAMQNKKDGNRLPIKPDKKTKPILLKGILRICLIVSGSKTSPAEAMRREATW